MYPYPDQRRVLLLVINILLELYYRNGMITIVSGTKQSMVTLMGSEYTHENYGHLIY